MTKDQATTLRLRGEQRAYPISCEHMTLESERTGEGHVKGKYICLLCGEFVARLEPSVALVLNFGGECVSHQGSRAKSHDAIASNDL